MQRCEVEDMDEKQKHTYTQKDREREKKKEKKKRLETERGRERKRSRETEREREREEIVIPVVEDCDQLFDVLLDAHLLGMTVKGPSHPFLPLSLCRLTSTKGLLPPHCFSFQPTPSLSHL